MKILLTGKNGQVSFELSKKLSELGDIIAIDREDLDLENSEDISLFLDQTKPDLTIHPPLIQMLTMLNQSPICAIKLM